MQVLVQARSALLIQSSTQRSVYACVHTGCVHVCAHMWRCLPQAPSTLLFEMGSVREPPGIHLALLPAGITCTTAPSIGVGNANSVFIAQ